MGDLQIKEEIEEVVTTYSDQDDDTSEDHCQLPEFDLTSTGHDDTWPAVTRDTDTWQQNWLFRRHGGPSQTKFCPPVSMLVPNPLQVCLGIGNVPQG